MTEELRTLIRRFALEAVRRELTDTGMMASIFNNTSVFYHAVERVEFEVKTTFASLNLRDLE